MEIVSCKLCSHYICRTIFGQVIEPFCALGYPLEPCPDFEDETTYVASQLSNDVASMKQLQAESSLLIDALANYEQENLELVGRVAELEAQITERGAVIITLATQVAELLTEQDRLREAVREGYDTLLIARDYHGFACTENLNRLRVALAGKEKE